MRAALAPRRWASISPARLGRARRADARARARASGSARCSRPQRALAAVDASDRAEVFFALRAALCSTRAELTALRRRVHGRLRLRRAAPTRSTTWGRSPSRRCRGSRSRRRATRRPRADLTPAPAAWSEEELLREKDFARLHGRRARRWRGGCSRRIALRGPKRRSRRTVPTKRRRDEHDLRATIRASLRTGGELLERRYREQAERPRRLVLICDVSGSMAPYSRMLLQYMQACVAARARVEAFVVRHPAHPRHPRAARARLRPRARTRAAAAVNDWSRRHPHRRGDRRAQPRARPPDRPRLDGHPALRRLGPRRAGGARGGDGAPRAHRVQVVWLNPLAADPRYEPLTRGMKAAMPHVDRLLPGNSISSLEALADLMEEGTA